MSTVASLQSGAMVGQSRSVSSTVLLLLFLLPSLIIFTLFVVMPMMEAGWYSFFSWNGLNTPTNFIGLGNYIEAIRAPGFRMAC